MSKHFVKDTLDEYASDLLPTQPDVWPKLQQATARSTRTAPKRLQFFASLRAAVVSALLLLGMFLAVFALQPLYTPLFGSGQAAQLYPGFIPFSGPVSSNSRIYVTDGSGSGLAVLAANEQLYHYEPRWSPNGSKIAFAAGADRTTPQLYVMDADGSQIVQLTSGKAAAWSPAWSPDGSKLAFSSGEGQNRDIYTVNSDGSGLMQLTTERADDKTPAWAPDGKQLAFASTRDGNDEIYIMNPDGSDQRRITSGDSNDLYPAWSPAGDKIAYSSNGSQGEAIWVIDTTGGDPTQLTDGRGLAEAPVWSSDGKQIMFMSALTADWDISIMNADGSGLTNLTNSPDMSEAWPDWSPDGRRITFVGWIFPLPDPRFSGTPTPTIK